MLPEPEVTEMWYPKNMEARYHGLITRSILKHVCKIIDSCHIMFRADRRRRLGDQMLPEPEVTETWYPKNMDQEAGQYLATRLQGPALKVLNNLPSGSSISHSELVAQLECRFGPGEQAENFLMELRMRRKRRDKSLQQLGQAIRDLTGLAYPEMSATARERLAKTHFWQKHIQMRESLCVRRVFQAHPSADMREKMDELKQLKEGKKHIFMYPARLTFRNKDEKLKIVAPSK